MKVKETSVVYSQKRKPFTYQEYVLLPEDGQRYEVLNGELIMVPAPITIHQRISTRIETELIKYLEKNKTGEFFHAPYDVVLSDRVVVQPDILFVSKKNSHIIGEKNISGAPDLVIEIISHSTGYYDLVEKKDIYETYGVKEYWIVDPMKRRVEIYVNRKNKFEQLMRIEQDGILNSTVLEGFILEYKTIFQNLSINP